MVSFTRKNRYTYEDLVDILRILRAPDGCPWDREQTHLSNRRNFLEEAYEAAEAFDRDDPALMCEELGDMLMQVLFNIHIEEDLGRFTTEDVTTKICEKLIFRHPHIFSDASAASSEEVLVNWDKLKAQEKSLSSTAEAMEHVAKSLPGIWRADKLQSKAAKVGFEFADVEGALQKLEEEVRELREAARALEAEASPYDYVWEHKREARDAAFQVVRLSDHVFRVVGPRVERMVVQTDWDNEEAIAFLQHRFKRIGVDKALDAAGACDGDEIRIVGYAFEYESTRMAQDMFDELED